MPPETSGWKDINWKKVNRRSHRPIKHRGYIPFRVWGLIIGSILTLLCALLLPKVKITWAFGWVFLSFIALAWLGWAFWPVIENYVASRYVIKAHVVLKPKIRFWQKDMLPLEIVVRKAFKITRNGDLIEASNWLGRCRISVPAWFYHSVDDREEFDMLCLSTHKMLGRLEEYLLP